MLLLGDLSRSGYYDSLKRDLKLATETSLATWVGSGNHGCFERTGALKSAVERVGAKSVRLATPGGETAGEELRAPGAGVESGDWG